MLVTSKLSTGFYRCRTVPLTHARYSRRLSSTQTTVDVKVKQQNEEKKEGEEKEAKNKLLSQLVGKIRVGGAMTIADYMREALTHPVEGYYMKGDVFGARGDFTTSPEISPMFGEMLGIWFLNEWMKLGQPSPVNFVELGPGRGTLISDILRVMTKYESFQKNAAVHLVEVSPGLTEYQKNVLCSDPRPPVDPNRPPMPLNDRLGQEPCQSKFGVPVYWHNIYETVPRGYFTLWLAHELFDALPVHLLRKVDGSWKEVLVDEDPNKPGKLRYVISRHGTPIARAFVKDDEKRNYAEVRPQAAVMMQNIGRRIHEDGGFFLGVDYGHDGQEKDSFRAYKKHEQVEPLEEPGSADLTADVDFGDLRKWAAAEGNEVLCYGPTPQGEFLHNLGIKVRLQRLLENCNNEDQKESLLTGFDMITAPHQMGEKFKAFSVFPGTVKEIHRAFPPSGFFPLPKV